MTGDMSHHRQKALRYRCARAMVLSAICSAGCQGSKAYPTRDGGGQDHRKEAGPVNVVGVLNPCPEVVIVASPNRTSVGAQSQLTAHAADPDSDVLTYRWEADLGTLAAPTLPETIFTCTRPGAVSLKLTVDDGDCETVEMATLLCMPGDGGTGDSSDGRPGDGPADGGTGTDGRQNSDAVGAIGGGGGDTAVTASGGSSGGNGSGGASGGSTGATGGASSGGTTAQTGGMTGTQPGSGGATVTGGTSGGSGSGGMSGASGGAGRDGTAARGGSNGSGGIIGSGGSPAGTGGVGPGGGGSCDECSRAMCLPEDGCYEIADPADKQLCQAAYDCFVTKQCATGGEPLLCFCGNSGAACSANGAADGVCLNEVAAAARAEPSQGGLILTRYPDYKYPIGRATNLLACQALLCPTECKANLGL